MTRTASEVRVHIARARLFGMGPLADELGALLDAAVRLRQQLEVAYNYNRNWFGDDVTELLGETAWLAEEATTDD